MPLLSGTLHHRKVQNAHCTSIVMDKGAQQVILTKNSSKQKLVEIFLRDCMDDIIDCRYLNAVHSDFFHLHLDDHVHVQQLHDMTTLYFDVVSP